MGRNTDDCQTDDDCNIENAVYATTRECKQGFKNMTTDCECLKEYYCRNGDGPCPLKCYPKKIDGCEHWGDNCISCKTAKGVNSCKNKEIEGQCQEDGKCNILTINVGQMRIAKKISIVHGTILM